MRVHEPCTNKTVKARFWPWLSGDRPQNRMRCSVFARKRNWTTWLLNHRGVGRFRRWRRRRYAYIYIYTYIYIYVYIYICIYIYIHI